MRRAERTDSKCFSAGKMGVAMNAVYRAATSAFFAASVAASMASTLAWAAAKRSARTCKPNRTAAACAASTAR